jgi:uncharacterized membrane protein YgcG
LAVIKEAKRWSKAELISKDNYSAIQEHYKVPFYHPNIMIRILLFVATLLAISGVTGLLGVFFSNLDDELIAIGCALYGIASFVVLEKALIKNNHFKSGVTEAILYHACGFTIGGIAGIVDFDYVALTVWTSAIVFGFAAVRYLDLVSTTAAILSFAYAIFHHLYSAGGIFQQIIPFVFIIVFGAGFFFVRSLRNNPLNNLWSNVLIVSESLCLLLAYAGGNYLIVRELSINLLNLQLEPQQDIPFAMVFYILTIILPIAYLYFGIQRKDIVLIRVSLFMVAFSVFTFKYYYSFGHPEITITLAGAIVLIITLVLMNYLKVIRNGYTRENLLSEKWASMNVQAFVISQTMGGNLAPEQADMPGGGSSGGGGSTDRF